MPPSASSRNPTTHTTSTQHPSLLSSASSQPNSALSSSSGTSSSSGSGFLAKFRRNHNTTQANAQQQQQQPQATASSNIAPPSAAPPPVLGPVIPIGSSSSVAAAAAATNAPQARSTAAATTSSAHEDVGRYPQGDASNGVSSAGGHTSGGGGSNRAIGSVSGISGGGSGSSASSSLAALPPSARTLSGALGVSSIPAQNQSSAHRSQYQQHVGQQQEDIDMSGMDVSTLSLDSPMVQQQQQQQQPQYPQQHHQQLQEQHHRHHQQQQQQAMAQAQARALEARQQAHQAQEALQYASQHARVAALNAVAAQAALTNPVGTSGQHPQQVGSHGNGVGMPSVGVGGAGGVTGGGAGVAGIPQQVVVGASTAPGATTLRKTAGRYALADFAIERTLGTGSFGRVHLVRSRHNGRFYAIKVLNKDKVVRMKQVEHTNSEREMLVRVRHPFLVNLWGTFSDVANLYMVMDFVAGGELFSLLRKSQRFPNSVAKFYAAEVALALDYLHSLDIIYRDLKPENLLLGADGHVKVTDFGFAKHVPDITWTLCGTPDYLAPEVVQSKGYNKSVDWYALGVLIFEMLAGYPPFFTEDGNPMRLYEKIIAGKVRYPSYFDALARDLLRNLLTTDITKRFGNLRGGSADIFSHGWFAEVDWDKLYRREIPAPYVPKIEGDGDASQFDRYAEADVSEYGKTGHGPHDHLFPEF